MKLDVEREIAELHQLSTGQLCQRYGQVFGEPTRSRHRAYLIRKIAWRIQALAEGGLSERARQRAADLAQGAELRVMPPKTHKMAPVAGTVMHAAIHTDPRLPTAGSAIVRRYKGRTLQILIHGDGFEFEGERFKSLTAVAKKITGSHCNGFRFFGLEAAQ